MAKLEMAYEKRVRCSMISKIVVIVLNIAVYILFFTTIHLETPNIDTIYL
jgi:hypothetical protein